MLLGLNVLVVVLSTPYGRSGNYGPEIIELAFSLLLRAGMLVVAGVALVLTAWLDYKRKYGKTALFAGIIVGILTVSLAFPAKPGGLGRSAQTGADLLFPGLNTAAQKTVTGIVFSEDKPSVVIGSQLMREGDIIRGVRIAKIYKDKVEFEKNGVTWTQAVRESPSPNWDLPLKPREPDREIDPNDLL